MREHLALERERQLDVALKKLEQRTKLQLEPIHAVLEASRVRSAAAHASRVR